MTDASQGAHADEQDASMDTILASIRRIIMEDEAGAAPPQPSHEQEDERGSDEDDDLLVLQPSMIVDPAGPGGETMAHPAGPSHPGTQNAADLAAALFDDPPPAPAIPPAAPPPPPPPPPVASSPEPPRPAADPAPHDVATEALLAPAASLAAAQSLASLQDAMRPAAPSPSAPLRLLRNGGPTIEDMVREELRAQLKDWLDANLPSLVERLVAQEIGRLVGRG